MCLAVPVKIKEVLDNNMARVQINGVTLEASSILVGEVNVGEYVLIHAGFIIQKISTADAKDKLDLWKEYQDKIGKNNNE